MSRVPFVALCITTLAACSNAADRSGESPPVDSGGTAHDAFIPDDPPTIVDGYPAGPFGLKRGQVFPNLALHGYRDGAGAWTDITLRDYFDPDGSRGIHGIYLTVSAPWCAGCVAEARSFPALYRDTYQGKGARLITALVQDGASKPATQKTVDAWIAAYDINYDVVADPELNTVRMDASSSGSLALPYNYVIDPRTMRITQINAGPIFTGGSIVGLDDLLAKNGR
ncbi:MAG: redoxin domain-containing protein [Polyangiales bacterium]